MVTVITALTDPRANTRGLREQEHGQTNNQGDTFVHTTAVPFNNPRVAVNSIPVARLHAPRGPSVRVVKPTNAGKPPAPTLHCAALEDDWRVVR